MFNKMLALFFIFLYRSRRVCFWGSFHVHCRCLSGTLEIAWLIASDVRVLLLGTEAYGTIPHGMIVYA